MASNGNDLPVLLLVKNRLGSCKISGPEKDLHMLLARGIPLVSGGCWLLITLPLILQSTLVQLITLPLILQSALVPIEVLRAGASPGLLEGWNGSKV